MFFEFLVFAWNYASTIFETMSCSMIESMFFKTISDS